MIKFENTEVFNFEGAFRGMRNPLNSWDKSDSVRCNDTYSCEACKLCRDEYDYLSDDNPFILGKNDLALAQKLINAGSDHRKFMRQIFVSVDITSWATWWAEFDTYKVATVRNSCSKMHKIHVKAFERSDFSLEGVDALIDKKGYPFGTTLKIYVDNIIDTLETLRNLFNKTGDKDYWRALLELLPHSYNMRATVTLNYETLRNIYFARRNHKLDEWRVGFMEWIDSLPYADELIKYGG